MPNNLPPRFRAPGWIELSVALAALIVSAVSIYIAQKQTEVMHSQLAASIWPAVQYSTSNLRGGELAIIMSLQSVGVGPARIHTFDVSHEGRPIANLAAFVAECCAPEDTPVQAIESFVVGRILPAGEELDFFTLPADPDNPDVYDRFNRVRSELDIRLCYCSVLEDCWVVSRASREPESVQACPVL